MTLHSEKAIKKSNRNAIKSEAVRRLTSHGGVSPSAPAEQIFEPSNTILKIALAGVATLLLAGVALVVSANPNIPVSSSTSLQSKLQSNSMNAQNLTTQSAVPVDYATYYRHMHGVARATVSSSKDGFKKPGYSLNAVNVNTFLLAARISNDSQLAELQMQPTFAEF